MWIWIVIFLVFLGIALALDFWIKWRKKKADKELEEIKKEVKQLKKEKEKLEDK